MLQAFVPLKSHRAMIFPIFARVEEYAGHRFVRQVSIKIYIYYSCLLYAKKKVEK